MLIANYQPGAPVINCPYNFHSLIIDHLHATGCLDPCDYSCTCKYISHDIFRIYPPAHKNSKIHELMNNGYQQSKHFIHVLCTVNKSTKIRMIISLFHGIQKKIFKWFLLTEKVWYCHTASFMPFLVPPLLWHIYCTI